MNDHAPLPHDPPPPGPPATPEPPSLHRRWTLPVSDGHLLQIQGFGPVDGRPALALHGGPGSGGTSVLAAVFDLRHWRVIVPDQRGAGGSAPAGDVQANTTPHLLDDLRRLRAHLGLARWLVFGGSWGATLALAHAADDPAGVEALVLRASFLARDEDIDWFFRGAAAVRPEAWQALSDAVEGAPVQQTLSDWLLGDDPVAQARGAVAWRRWEHALAGHPVVTPEGAALAAQVQRLRIQAHYLRHGCWMDPPLLARLARIPLVPTFVTHARDDQICRFDAALELAQRMPHAVFVPTERGGHDPTHSLAHAAVSGALATYRERGRFGT